MNLVSNYFRELFRATRDGWNRFWFTPADPATLGLVRIFAGAMLFYTHFVWSLDLEAFVGPKGWVSREALARLPGDWAWSTWHWSYLNWIDSPTVLWIAHVAALVVFLLLTLGLFSRTMAILGYLITVSYANRAWFALFGLDDINALLALYLAIGPSGAAFSLDRLWKRRKSDLSAINRIEPRIDANIAIRLIQIHMCVIYLFAALGKLMGASWWGGWATWLSVANLEYQSIDVTWLAAWPIVGSLLTHITVWWELSYCVLIWPRLTRPLMLAFAIPIHLGIALFLGMQTFGLVMLIGNFAFVSPWLIRRIFSRRASIDEGRAGGRMAGPEAVPVAVT
jgi:hypothetical protein